jgi:hypothetical protein
MKQWRDVMGGIALLAAGAVIATVAVGTVAARRSPPSRETAVTAARTHAVRGSGTAFLLGMLVAVYVGANGLGNSAPGGLGVTALLLPLTFGVVHVLVLAIGELTWPRPHGEVRRARLVRRGMLDAAPGWLVRTAAAGLALAGAVVVAGALLADDTGRRFTYAPDGLRTATASPFPGLFYGRVATVGLLLLVLSSAAALWIVANRPAVATEDERTEAALRRASAHRVLRVLAGVALVVGGGLLFVLGVALHSVASSSVESGALGLSAVAASGTGLVALLAGAVVTCARAPGVPADAPVPTGG